jgi:hypothetical protein
MTNSQLTPHQQLVIEGLKRYPLLNKSMLSSVTGLKSKEQGQAVEELVGGGKIERAFLTNSQRATEVFFLAENREHLAPFLGNQK